MTMSRRSLWVVGRYVCGMLAVRVRSSILGRRILPCAVGVVSMDWPCVGAASEGHGVAGRYGIQVRMVNRVAAKNTDAAKTWPWDMLVLYQAVSVQTAGLDDPRFCRRADC